MRFLNFDTCDKCPACDTKKKSVTKHVSGGDVKVIQIEAFCRIRMSGVRMNMSDCPFASAEDLSIEEIVVGSKLFSLPLTVKLPSKLMFPGYPEKHCKDFGVYYLSNIDNLGCVVVEPKDENGFLKSGEGVIAGISECTVIKNLEEFNSNK